ncbi:glycosyltransferase family 4 protein [candidate division WOR-3 bacterium]|nr:glycosyltransferase family 4 protein [candidate division WOR-3 bacterium]
MTKSNNQLLCYINDPIKETTKGIKRYSLDYLEKVYNPNRMFGCVHLISLWGDEDSVLKNHNTLMFHPIRTKNLFLKPFLGLRVGLSIIKKFNISIIRNSNVHEIGLLGTVLGKITGIPVVQSIHDDYDRRYKLHSNYAVYLEKHIIETYNIQQALKVIAISDYLKYYARRHGAKSTNIVSVPKPVNLRQYMNVKQERVEKLKNKLNISGKRVFLFVGRYGDKQKNLGRLLKAYAGLSESIKASTILIVVGGTRKKEEKLRYKNYVDMLGISKHVIFTGIVGYKDLPLYYSISDLFVFPTLYEGFGMVFVEAMASGLPILTSNHPVPTQFVDKKNGIIVDPYSVDSIKKGIEKLLSFSNKEIKEMSKVSVERSFKYDEKNIFIKEEKLYRLIIGLTHD